MELKDYLLIIRKNLFLFILIFVILASLAYVLTKTRPLTYTAATSFTVSKSSKINPVEIYDPLGQTCTNLQLSNSYANTINAWLISPAVVTEIYQASGLKIPKVSQDTLAKTFRPVNTPGEVVMVTVSGQDADQLLQLLNASDQVLQSKTTQLSDIETNNYKLTKESSIVTLNSINLWRNTLIGLLSGILLSMIAVMMINYFKTKR